MAPAEPPILCMIPHSDTNRWGGVVATKIQELINRYGALAREVLSDRSIPATYLARELSKAGYPIGATSIKDYRRKLDTEKR